VPHRAHDESSDLDLVALVTAAKRGDPSAIAQLLFTLRPIVFRFCRARLGHGPISAAAEDVTQEALLAIFMALPRYEARQGFSFRWFALAIAARKIADAQRAAARSRVDLVSQLPDRVGPEDNAPEQQALVSERAQQLRTVMQILPPQQRAILGLRIVLGLDANDTAKALGMSATAVRVAEHRALRTLRNRPELEG